MFRSLRNWLSFKVILAGIVFAVFVFAVLLAILWSARAYTITQTPASALLNIVVAPTQTVPAPVMTSTPTMEPTSPHGEPLPSGDIEIGEYVQVTGTGGDGLRLHTTARVSSEVHYIAIEAQVFLVKDGPIDADGYLWWLLNDPYNDNEVGWGVSNYLSVVVTP